MEVETFRMIAAMILTQFASNDGEFIVGMRASGAVDYWNVDTPRVDCVVEVWDSRSGVWDSILGSDRSREWMEKKIVAEYLRHQLAGGQQC